MNCEAFRQAVGADPDTPQPEVLEHAAACPACAQYRTEMITLNGLIHRALQVDVSAQPPVRRTAMNWRIAATILLSVIVFSIGWLAYPRASLAEQVVSHVLEESPWLVRTDTRVDLERVRDVLNHSGVFLNNQELAVSYAMVCTLGKHDVAHLVVQSENGPVTVLVLAHERAIERPQRFEEQGFVGTFVPAPRGVLAVLARNGAVEEVAATALRALRYEDPGQRPAANSMAVSESSAHSVAARTIQPSRSHCCKYCAALSAVAPSVRARGRLRSASHRALNLAPSRARSSATASSASSERK